MNNFYVSGQLIDLRQRRTYPASVQVEASKIISITEVADAPLQYILPGFVDAHIHIESSMLTPCAFAKAASMHGTVATISDPHEIANVCGMDGVRYMIANSKLTPFKVFFGAPSCVPATAFETAGVTLDAADVDTLLKDRDIWYLSEMMNYPGVLHQDPQVMAKIAAAHAAGKPVDGHAPGLRGDVAKAYAAPGISTDHECFTLDEALDKIAAGMHILIREGSAAKNYEALHPLLGTHPERVMLCSDDKHPDELVLGHINLLVKRSLALGYNLYDVLCAACINPVEHYKVPVGTLQVGDPADFIIVDNLNDFSVTQTYIDGQLVAENGQPLLPDVAVEPINNFHAQTIKSEALRITAHSSTPTIRVIDAIEGQLVTGMLQLPGLVVDGYLMSDIETDVLKLAVINRYEANAAPALAFIKGFGLKTGAIASTVGHDCHNIIAVGTDDQSMAAAINALIYAKGGISVAWNEHEVQTMPLPIAGLMSCDSAMVVAEAYTHIDAAAKELGTSMKAPFMTLSFMALLVIPSLKLSDKGLFDGNAFEFCSVEIEQ